MASTTTINVQQAARICHQHHLRANADLRKGQINQETNTPNPLTMGIPAELRGETRKWFRSMKPATRVYHALSEMRMMLRSWRNVTSDTVDYGDRIGGEAMMKSSRGEWQMDRRVITVSWSHEVTADLRTERHKTLPVVHRNTLPILSYKHRYVPSAPSSPHTFHNAESL